MNIYPSQLFLFLAGFLVFFRMDLVGVLTLSELLTLGYVLLNWRRVWDVLLADRLLKTVMLAWVSYLSMQVLSDMVNHTQPVDFYRGWARLAFFAVNTAALASVARGRADRIVAFFLGYALSLALASQRQMNEYLIEWKFGYGPALTLAVTVAAGLLPSHQRDRTGGLLLMGIGILNLYNGARSLGGLCLFVGGLSFFSGYFRDNLRNRGLLSVRFLVPVALALVAIYSLYTHGASTGMLGEKTREKYEKQTRGGRNVVSGGRMEYTIAIPAIMESPLLGYGSWARNLEFVKKYIQINGMDPDSYDAQFLLDLGTIPTHSHILGSWAEAGVAGGVFWLLVLYMAGTAFFRILSSPDIPYRLFCLFAIAWFAWDIVFSPFGLERRVTDPSLIVLLASLGFLKHAPKNGVSDGPDPSLRQDISLPPRMRVLRY